MVALVLLQDEVNPVMSALLDNGLEVTALHNHFFWDEPRMFYMHVHGHGSPMDLARKVKPALDLIGRQAKPTSTPAAAAPGGGTLDAAKLAQIAGHMGEQNGAVYKITVGRDDLKITEMGAPINSRMGLNTWAAFVGTDAKAAIAGDVAMLPAEVTPVLKALRQNSLDVIAIHHHMLDTHCTTCHGPNSPNGPHAATIEDHTHHQKGSAGGECVACHMPKIEQTIADVNVRSHTFKFISPGMTEQLKIPNPCTGYHTDRTNEWATVALKGWSGTSPWRVN
jgi:Domain of Unknown Function (DUF1259)